MPGHAANQLGRPVSLVSLQTAECTDLVSRWVQDMSQHFKSLDQRHLLTVGSEGALMPGDRAGQGRAVRARGGAGQARYQHTLPTELALCALCNVACCLSGRQEAGAEHAAGVWGST